VLGCASIAVPWRIDWMRSLRGGSSVPHKSIEQHNSTGQHYSTEHKSTAVEPFRPGSFWEPSSLSSGHPHIFLLYQAPLLPLSPLPLTPPLSLPPSHSPSLAPLPHKHPSSTLNTLQRLPAPPCTDLRSLHLSIPTRDWTPLPAMSASLLTLLQRLEHLHVLSYPLPTTLPGALHPPPLPHLPRRAPPEHRALLPSPPTGTSHSCHNSQPLKSSQS